MADYYPLIARAVTGLEKNTGEARRALYERARTALVAQLRGIEPALSEADIARERSALEESIRKVELEAARRSRQEMPPAPPQRANVPPPPVEPPVAAREAEPEPEHEPESEPESEDREAAVEEPAAEVEEETAEPPTPVAPPEARAPEPPQDDWEELHKELDRLAPPPEPRPESDGQEASPPPAPEPASEPPARPAVQEPALPPAPARRNERFSAAKPSPSLVDEGLKGFRDVVAESDDLGNATASASRSARQTREALAGLTPGEEIERIEPRFDPQSMRLREEELSSPPPRRPERPGARMTPPRPPEEFDEPGEPLRTGWSRAAVVVVTLAVLVALGGAGFLAWQAWGPSVAGLFQSRPTAPTQASRDAAPARPKIADRVGGTQQDSGQRAAPAPAAAVAQRVVLYEQVPNSRERRQYVGSVIWRTEAASPGPGQPPDTSIRADVEIPERQMRMSFVLRRNLDQSLPASHTIEVLFSTPADFQPGGIGDVTGVFLEDTEQTRGLPLIGTRVKVTNGFFLVGLSAVEADLRRNLQLLKDRGWLHIRLTYNNGQPALMAVEKGVPGDRVIEEALAAWGQSAIAAPQR